MVDKTTYVYSFINLCSGQQVLANNPPDHTVLDNGHQGFDSTTKATFCSKANISPSLINWASYAVTKLSSGVGNVFLGSAVQSVTLGIATPSLAAGIVRDLSAVRGKDKNNQTLLEMPHLYIASQYDSFNKHKSGRCFTYQRRSC